MSRKASSVRSLPPGEARQDDSPAPGQPSGGPAEHKVTPIRPAGAEPGPLKNRRYEHFAQFIARGDSPAWAYASAGYRGAGARQSAARLLRQKDVSDRVEELKKAVSRIVVDKIAVDKEWVVANLVEIVARAMQAVPVQDREGKLTGQYTFKSGEAIRALGLIGRHLGMFETKSGEPERLKNLAQSLIDGRQQLRAHRIREKQREMNLRAKKEETPAGYGHSVPGPDAPEPPAT
jgi:phage terminase small subunit